MSYSAEDKKLLKLLKKRVDEGQHSRIEYEIAIWCILNKDTIVDEIDNYISPKMMNYTYPLPIEAFEKLFVKDVLLLVGRMVNEGFNLTPDEQLMIVSQEWLEVLFNNKLIYLLRGR